MGKVNKDFRRRAARALEWFVVEFMADKVPPLERLLLLYEVTPRLKRHDARVERARALRSRGGFGVDDFALTSVNYEQLAAVLGSPEWMEERIGQCAAIAPHQARCIILQDSDAEPEVMILNARTARRTMASNERREG
jgi:hypothetical protein